MVIYLREIMHASQCNECWRKTQAEGQYLVSGLQGRVLKVKTDCSMALLFAREGKQNVLLSSESIVRLMGALRPCY